MSSVDRDPLAPFFADAIAIAIILRSGADDDASGTSLILAVARHIHTNRLIFSRKLGTPFIDLPGLGRATTDAGPSTTPTVLALFAGEEQGLLGSSWYANHLKNDKKEDVVWMLQVDMVGASRRLNTSDHAGSDAVC